MKKILLIGVCCLCLVGCGKKEESLEVGATEIESAKRSCCTDSGGLWKDNSCQKSDKDTWGAYDESGYNSCASYADSVGEQCCNDFKGHWNSYKSSCTLTKSEDKSDFSKCVSLEN